MDNLEKYTAKCSEMGLRLMSVCTTRFFAGGYVAEADEMVIYDMEEAIAYATDENIGLNKGSEYKCWREILDRHGKAGRDEVERLQLGDDFTETLNSFSYADGIQEKGEEEGIPSPLIDLACANFMDFLTGLLFVKSSPHSLFVSFFPLQIDTKFDKLSAFHQKLLKVYKGGGIPCGWKGEFPEGCLIVYSKTEKYENPNFEIYAEKYRKSCDALVALIESPRFFAGGYVAQPNEIVIHEAKDAAEYATEQFSDYYTEDYPQLDDLAELDYRYWTEILERMSDRTNDCYEEEKRLKLHDDEAFGRLQHEMNQRIVAAINQKQEKEKIHEYLASGACETLTVFLDHMALFGELDAFHQRLYNIYASGGIPFGWKGEPFGWDGKVPKKGHFLVYSKTEKYANPNFEIYAEKLRANKSALWKMMDESRFFAGGYVAQPDEIVIHDEEEAVDYATNPCIGEAKGAEYQSWANLRKENDPRNAWRDAMRRLHLHEDVEFDLLRGFMKYHLVDAIHIKSHIQEIHPHLVGWVFEDFYRFLIYKTLFGELDAFHQKLYNVYADGGIPCGWKGEFPDGNLLVYSK
jgi:hypothetical protein